MIRGRIFEGINGGRAVFPSWLPGFLIAIVFLLLCAPAVSGEPPYPPSNVIEKITFAPADTIVRKADGSDNWPITWCDDDSLFTSYGDGWGFKPRIDKKLSQGFAKILGGPADFRAINVRSETGETTGDGARGPKASGMLMVDGVLYMWVRNTGNSTLAWSKDRGKTWEWGFKFTESFGCPAFLNFGSNYEGARDDYVYTYSQDGPTAYEPADRMVLARVPKAAITDRSAYEFFVERNAGGEPVWTKDIQKRGGVFAHKGNCERCDAVFVPGIDRYLLLLGFNHDSGWGIFDAPNPWGPWTTAFYTERWDIEGTHGYRIPTKWIGDNGRTMYLVFSGMAKYGYDAFCVRKTSLVLK